MVTIKATSNKSAVPTLKSDKRLSKANYDFDVYDEVWDLTANIKINFGLMSNLKVTSKFKNGFRLALAVYASEFSAGYVTGIFQAVRDICSYGVKNTIKEQHVVNYKSSLTKDTERKLGSARAFLLDWVDKEFFGIDKKVADLLESMKLSGGVKGRAVATGCPYSGAYTFEEQAIFINWYVDAYTNKLINLEEYALIMTLQQTGARSIQISYLYFGDLVTRIETDIEYFDLNIPNAKKIKENIRQSFHERKDISEDLMLVLTTKAKQSICAIETHFSIKLNDEEKKLIPIFLRTQDLSNYPNIDTFWKTHIANPDFFCIRSGQFSRRVSKVARLCPLKTSRIIIDDKFGYLHINPRRFRYTHATNMAIVGAGDLAIAEELGHEDTQHVKVYTEFKEEIADRLDEALASSLVPLAQAFSGTLIDSERDAIRVNDPRSRINNNIGNTVGNCGKFGFCANGTIHCYTCNKFQPWVNAPHKEVLDSVVSDQNRKRKMGASEFVLESHNRSINAIKVVIQKCEQRKEELRNKEVVDV